MGETLAIFFCAPSSMERETIYVQGDRATTAAESPRLISSGGSEAGIETPITITGGGSRKWARGGFQGTYAGVDPAWEK